MKKTGDTRVPGSLTCSFLQILLNFSKKGYSPAVRGIFFVHHLDFCTLLGGFFDIG